MKYLLVTVLALSATVTADPAVLLGNGFLSSPYTSAALVAPAAAPVIAPTYASAYSPLASYTSLSPVLSDYRSYYNYGSSYNYQDYVPVNSGLSLPYSLPYAYAADWYYRK